MNTNVQLEKILQQQEDIHALLKNLCDSKEENKVYSITDLMEMFNVSRRTLFTWKSKGILTFGQIGQKLYVTQQELDRFINNLSKGGKG